MLQITYTCTIANSFSIEELVALLKKARKRNAAADITGMLLYHESRSLHVMEGPGDKVEGLLENFVTVRPRPSANEK